MMLIESARIVSIEADCLWVSTVQSSTCGQCVAKSGCGQSLLARWSDRDQYLRILLPLGIHTGHRSEYAVGQSVEIGVPENLVALSSLLVYCLPLVMMIIGASMGHFIFEIEWVSIFSALLGLMFGATLIRWHAHRNRHDRRMQPQLIEHRLIAVGT